MLPTEDLFVCVCVLIDDLVTAGIIAIPRRPGPAPACSDAGLVTIAQVRHLPGRRSEAGLLAEVARDWAHLFPCWPHQGEASRRIRWLWGASGQLRCHLAGQVPADDCQQTGTSALPVKHTSRVRGPDSWTGPQGPHARFGRDAAPAEWFHGFRLAIKTDLGARIIRARASCPPPSTSATSAMTCWKPGRRRVWRNRIETAFQEITAQMELGRHGAHTFWGLLTRTAAVIAARTLMRVCLAGQ